MNLKGFNKFTIRLQKVAKTFIYLKINAFYDVIFFHFIKRKNFFIQKKKCKLQKL